MNKIYLSLPITGKCEISQRRKAKMFQRYFEGLGHAVVNPFDLYDHLKNCHVVQNKRPPTYKEILEDDLCNLDFCSHVFLLNGWQNSSGCIQEVERALDNDIQFLFELNFKFE